MVLILVILELRPQKLKVVIATVLRVLLTLALAASHYSRGCFLTTCYVWSVAAPIVSAVNVAKLTIILVFSGE